MGKGNRWGIGLEFAPGNEEKEKGSKGRAYADEVTIHANKMVNVVKQADQEISGLKGKLEKQRGKIRSHKVKSSS